MALQAAKSTPAATVKSPRVHALAPSYDNLEFWNFLCKCQFFSITSALIWPHRNTGKKSFQLLLSSVCIYTQTGPLQIGKGGRFRKQKTSIPTNGSKWEGEPGQKSARSSPRSIWPSSSHLELPFIKAHHTILIRVSEISWSRSEADYLGHGQ